MKKRVRILAMAAATAIASVAAIGVSQPAFAGTGVSTWCNDGTPGMTEVTLLRSPITLAVEIGRDGSPANPHIAVCYATVPEGTPGDEAAGGWMGATALCGWCGQSDEVWTGSDSNSQSHSAIQANTDTGTSPTYSLTPGPAGTTGDTIAVNIPVSLCVGQCSGGTIALGRTGLLVGQLQPQTAPGQFGASYQLTALQLWVNGIEVMNLVGPPVGAGVNPFGQVADSLVASGPCVGSVCAPLGGYVETTGAAPLVVLQLPTGTSSVTVPKECLYQNPSGSCP